MQGIGVDRVNKRLKLSVILFLIVLALQAHAEPATVNVRVGHLNMRSEPSEDAEIIGKLADGTKLDADRSKNLLFAAVLSGDNVIGWVADKYLEFENDITIEKITQPITYRVLADVYVLSDIKGTVEIVGSLKQGDVIEATDTAKDYVHMLGGGWVPKAAVE